MMLTRNSKMKKATLKTYNFDIPAGLTCIGAGACLQYCYATKGAYQYPVVKTKHNSNWEASKIADFVAEMTREIAGIKGLDAIRIHSAGDFYSKEYLNKWIRIAELNEEVIFYCYTKSIPLFIGTKLPDNFRVIYSTGGKWDHLIAQYNLRSCRLVDEYSGEADSSDHDDSMIVLSNENIELIQRWA